MRSKSRMKKVKFSQDRPPNFRSDKDQLFLVYCYSCNRENYSLAVSSGVCAFCGWSEKKEIKQ